jgi:cellulose synthase operon protein C
MKNYPNRIASRHRNPAVRYRASIPKSIPKRCHERAAVLIQLCRIDSVACVCLLLVIICCTGKMTIAEDYSQCKSALRSGDYTGAAQCFEAALRNDANSEEIQALLLHTLRETGSFREAASRANAFLSANGNSSILHLERGLIAKATGDIVAAEKHLRRAIALAPGESTMHMDATRSLAELLEEIGRKPDARPLWDQLIERYRAGEIQGSQRLGNVAMAAWRRGYFYDARDIFMDATDPKRGEVSLQALADFGYLFLEKYNARDAIGVFRDCLKINKSYPDALMGIALAKKYDNAFETEVYARAALKVHPNLVPALNSLAELAIEEENLPAAIEKIHAALAINPANLGTLSLQAVCYYIRGDFTEFAKIEKRILEINPIYGRFYFTLAENLVSRRKYQEAVDFNRKAIALDPELWMAHVSLGMNLTRVGNLEEGRKAIQHAFDGDPFNVWAINSLDLFDQMDTFALRRSRHFSFRTAKEDEIVISNDAAALAEEVYEKLSRRYGFEPNGPLQIEIFPDHGGFAVRTLGLPGLAGALGVCFGKVIALDSPRARKADTFNWGSTLWHEFAHVISLQMTHYNIPRWFSEGLSVYEEHRARPGWGDNLTVSFIKAYKEGRLLKASELNSGFMRPKNPEQISLSYYQAGMVCEWIEEAFGFEKIRQALLLFAQNKSAEDVFRLTLGLSAAQMDAAYARFIDSRVKDVAAHLTFVQQKAVDGGETPRGLDREYWTHFLKSNPDDFFANLQVGAFLKKEGASAEAEIHLKKAQKLFPNYVEPGNPYQLLGQIYQETKRENEALAEFAAWSNQDGSAYEPLIKAAEIYRNRKDWNSAAKMLRLSIYINPYDPDIQKKLGDAAMELQQWETAISCYRALFALSPSDPAGAHYDIARALLASGNREEAKRETIRALEIAPSFSQGLQLLLKLSEKQ